MRIAALSALLMTSVACGNDLFQKNTSNPLFGIGSDKPAWRSIHIANVSVLPPERNPAGKWLLYCRGSGRNKDGYHDTIGLFEQSPEQFYPTGPWTEYAQNPVLAYGAPGSFDEKHLLDTAAVQDADGRVLVYYKAKDNNNNMGLCAAVSTNGYHFKKRSEPLLRQTGICDVVYHKGRYHLFRGEMLKLNDRETDKWILHIVMNVSQHFDRFQTEPEKVALNVGPPGTFDSRCVYGAKIFRLATDPRWFMLYQTSGKHIDYPDRFHAAWSNNLLDWHKVENERPLMRRGNRGQWDQGGIWTGSVIEHGGKLHIFYEGWGSFDDNQNPDEVYYRGGNSRVGVASVSTKEFLRWVDGN